MSLPKASAFPRAPGASGPSFHCRLLIHVVGRRAEVADLKTDILAHKALGVFMLLIMFYMYWVVSGQRAALEQAVAVLKRTVAVLERAVAAAAACRGE